MKHETTEFEETGGRIRGYDREVKVFELCYGEEVMNKQGVNCVIMSG